jgi:transcriptional regulator with XRE-family HTH domain
MNLGRAIREVIEARHYSQRAVAEAIDVSPNYLSYLLKNKRGIKMSTLEDLARVLSVPPSFFFILADDSRDRTIDSFNSRVRRQLSRPILLNKPKRSCRMYQLSSEHKETP